MNKASDFDSEICLSIIYQWMWEVLSCSSVLQTGRGRKALTVVVQQQRVTMPVLAEGVPHLPSTAPPGPAPSGAQRKLCEGVRVGLHPLSPSLSPCFLKKA